LVKGTTSCGPQILPISSSTFAVSTLCVADRQQFPVFRPELLDDGGKSGPECVGRNPGLGRRLLGDEIEQNGGDLQSMGINTIHDGLSQKKRAVGGCFQKKSSKKRAKEATLTALLALKPRS
jgi:hypothetical protein